MVIFLMRGTNEKHVGGKALLHPAEAVQQARQKLKALKEPGFQLWDLLRVPKEYKSKGIFVMGEQGSGKTLYMLYLIAEALKDPLGKAVIHDYRNDVYPFLLEHLKVPAGQVKLLHPFDKRACGWDVQADLEDEDTAEEIAGAFIEKEEKSVFFYKSARNIVKAVLTYHLYKSEENSAFRWRLHHVVEALQSMETIQRLIEAYPSLRYARDALKNEDVMATVFSGIGKIQTVANLWSWDDKELVSLKAWRRKERPELLILGTDPKRQTACEKINTALWAMVSKQVLDSSAPRLSDMWFFLDEFHALGRLEGIETFASTARDYKGNLVLLGQDINQLLKPSMYGREGTNIILQGCSTQIYFRCSGDASRWASQQIGNQKILKQSTDRRVSGGDVSTGTGEREEKEALVMPEDIQQLQKCSAERPLLDAVITTFLDDPFRYPMTFDAFRHVWATPKIERDYQPEGSRERMKGQQMTQEERIAFGFDPPQEDTRSGDDNDNTKQTKRRRLKPKTSRS